MEAMQQIEKLQNKANEYYDRLMGHHPNQQWLTEEEREDMKSNLEALLTAKKKRN